MDRVLQRAKRIFERAIELEPQARADYVRAQCAEDTPLKERVERLLGEHDKQGDFLASRSRDQADDRPRSMPKVVGHYRLIEKLGQGGMGVVYKAEDTKLERPVALKFLRAHAMEDPEYKVRFVREAKAAARLDHSTSARCTKLMRPRDRRTLSWPISKA